ncbi:hypothetical protein [Nitratifractor sp.]
MTFETSLELLKFHNVAYTIYALLIVSVIAWFAYNLTRKEKARPLVRIPFYGYIAFLVAGGVGHHIFTYNTIPWVAEDIMRDEIKADRIYHIEVSQHQWKLPKEPMRIKEGQKVRFDVSSDDLTYGFGLLRKDGSLVMQMQVIPLYKNDLLWTFHECGTFDLVSTEYSGPDQYDSDTGKDRMLIRDAFTVECAHDKLAKK